jgi:hypothetical protein
MLTVVLTLKLLVINDVDTVDTFPRYTHLHSTKTAQHFGMNMRKVSLTYVARALARS